MTERCAEVAALLARLDAWPEAPTGQAQAVQWHYAQALAKRLAVSTPVAQAVLADKLEAALDGLAQATSPVAAEADGRPDPAGQASPWAALHEYKVRPGQGEGAQAASAAAPLPDLKSAVRFREVWALISAEAEVDLASFRAPTNAGPLNAHRLVLQVLAQMRDLSPAYLRHTLQHVDTLMWLEQTYASGQAASGKNASSKGSGRKTDSAKRAGTPRGSKRVGRSGGASSRQA